MDGSLFVLASSLFMYPTTATLLGTLASEVLPLMLTCTAVGLWSDGLSSKAVSFTASNWMEPNIQSMALYDLFDVC
jgi:hypothetical protein